MSGSVPIPFAIGETVWWCGTGYGKKAVECPECLGTCALKITLANGAEHSLACETCSRGWEGPCGIINVECGEFSPRPYVCQRVEVYSDGPRYQMDSGTGGYWPALSSDLFRDKDECAAECARRNEAKRALDEENHIDNLTRHRKKHAWSVHYWRQEAARLRKDLERVEARLAVCPKPREAKEPK